VHREWPTYKFVGFMVPSSAPVGGMVVDKVQAVLI